jgi:hypothetical protein
MPKKIYIAGKVTGLDYAETSMKFGQHEAELKRQGHDPIVPLNLVDRNDTWNTAMRKCIAALLTCDQIHMLHDWKESRGAKMEHDIAAELEMPIIYVKP